MAKVTICVPASIFFTRGTHPAGATRRGSYLRADAYGTTNKKPRRVSPAGLLLSGLGDYLLKANDIDARETLLVSRVFVNLSVDTLPMRRIEYST